MIFPEEYRVEGDAGKSGVFRIRLRFGVALVVASNELGWEHVSVSFRNRTPAWEEMSTIKSLFWSDDETVVEYHPKRSEYVNLHPFCLHLWRPTDAVLPTPPSILVGPLEKGASNNEG